VGTFYYMAYAMNRADFPNPHGFGPSPASLC
jgi:hypothetical protein